MGVIFESRTGDFGFGAVVMEAPNDIQDDKNYVVSHRRDRKGLPESVSVYLTPAATPTARQQAYGFNLDCLARLGGCKDSSELLPSAWSSI
jgi:hypothetical protein